jgi:aldehyde dehydrogenase (NAD+)
LGGKSPFIVFEDADIDAAIEGVVDAIWFNQGQVCCAGSRILVQEGITDDFHERLRLRMAKLRLGRSLDKTIDIGAIIDPKQLKLVSELVDEGVKAGATLFQPDMDMPEGGNFYPPTLLSNVQPTSKVATEEIFGPVVISMTFRTVDEAITLANHSRYGLSASIWSESINLSLEVAAKVEAGVVWVNATNLLDAAVGFGGRKESGFGREGGREGCFDYLQPTAFLKLPNRAPHAVVKPSGAFEMATIDRTAKLFVGGKQARPDGNYSQSVYSPKGALIDKVGLGNRKDIRNAVEAARKASAWGSKTAYNRAQILFYLGENLSARSQEFSDRIRSMTGASASKAKAEVDASVSRLFTYGSWADKYDGQVHLPPMRGVALALPESLGVVGAICPPEAPLLGLVSVIAPLMATGNRVVVVPSEAHPLCATDFYSVVETSDVPAGVLNIVTGNTIELAEVLSKHNDVDAMWAFGSSELSKSVEQNSVGNLKRTFVDYGKQIDWFDPEMGEGEMYLRKSTEVKNIWVPYGE